MESGVVSTMKPNPEVKESILAIALNTKVEVKAEEVEPGDNSKDKIVISKQSPPLPNLTKVVVRMDPITGKKYIWKDGKKFEIMSTPPLVSLTKTGTQLKVNALPPSKPPPKFVAKLKPTPPPLTNLASPKKLKLRAIPVAKRENITIPASMTIEEQIRPNIIIKQTTIGDFLNGKLIPATRAAVQLKDTDSLVINKEVLTTKTVDDLKYHVLSLNVRKQTGETTTTIATNSVGTMTDVGVTFHQCAQTECLMGKQDSSTQTEVPYPESREYPLDDRFVDFILGGGEFNDRESVDFNRSSTMGDPAKPRSKQEIDKLNFFLDMQKALRFDRSGNLPIHESVMQNNAKAVKKNCIILRARHESLDIYNHQRFTPLHLAILYDVTVEVLRTLLQYGADLSSNDSEGNTAFHLAVEHNRVALLKVLLEKAKVFQFDVHNFEGSTPLMMSCCCQSYDMTRMLLEKGANPNVKDLKSGRTALFHAAETHNVSIVQLLMEYKADSRMRNFFGTSPHDAMFELDDIPVQIRCLILGRDNVRLQMKKKIGVDQPEDGKKRRKLETSRVLRKVTCKDISMMISKS